METKTIAVVNGIIFNESDDMFTAEPMEAATLSMFEVEKAAEIAAIKTCNEYLLFGGWMESNFIANKFILVK